MGWVVPGNWKCSFQSLLRFALGIGLTGDSSGTATPGVPELDKPRLEIWLRLAPGEVHVRCDLNLKCAELEIFADQALEVNQTSFSLECM